MKLFNLVFSTMLMMVFIGYVVVFFLFPEIIKNNEVTKHAILATICMFGAIIFYQAYLIDELTDERDEYQRKLIEKQ
jgi:4-hydroxybenzoate polyprenyltransferase